MPRGSEVVGDAGRDQRVGYAMRLAHGVAALLVGLPLAMVPTPSTAAEPFAQTEAIDPLLAPYGAPSNGTTDAASALSSACAAAAKAGVPMQIDIAYSIQRTVTLACSHRFGRRGFYNVTPAKTLTISGSIVADPRQQLFSSPGAAVTVNGNPTMGSSTITNLTGGAIAVGAVASGPFVPAGTTVLSTDRGSVTLSADLTGSLGPAYGSLTYSFQPVNIIANAPFVSIAWWGAYAASQNGRDAAPAIRLAAGSNRTVLFPPAIYTIKSLTASPYPPASGIGATVGIDWFGFSDVEVLADGATFTTDAAHARASIFGLRYARNFKLEGLHFLAYSASFPGWINGTTLNYPSGTDLANGVAITGVGVTPGTYANGEPSCLDTGCAISVNRSQTVGGPSSRVALTAGLPCCEPSGLAVFNIRHFDIGPLWFDGNWGGSTKNPSAMGLFGAKDGTFHDWRIPNASVCVDGGLMQNTRWHDIRARGTNDAGSASGPSRSNCFNVERDGQMVGYYPSLVRDLGFATSSDNTLGPHLNLTNFAAGIFLRAGGRYRIVGDDVSRNLGATGYGGGAAGHTLGAGIYLLFETLPNVQTFNDPVTDVIIEGNIIRNNGVSGPSDAAQCGAARGAGAGIVMDGSCAVATSTTTLAASASSPNGAVLHFPPLTLPGWLEDAVVNGLRVVVTDKAAGGRIPDDATLSAIDLFDGLATLSADVNGGGVRAGDAIQFSTTGYEATNVEGGKNAVGHVRVAGNVFSGNGSQSVELINARALTDIAVSDKRAGRMSSDVSRSTKSK